MNGTNYEPAGVERPIKPDEEAILALKRVSTGADVHETNGLIHIYRLHCAAGNIAGAAEAKRNMYRRARELMRRVGDYPNPPGWTEKLWSLAQ